MIQKIGKRYQVIIQVEGVYFDTSSGRHEYSCELKKYVSPTFGSALVESGATLTLNLLDDSISGGVECIFTEVANIFMDADDAQDSTVEDDCVDIEVYMDAVHVKASPEVLAAWAKEKGWDLYDWSGPEVDHPDVSDVEDAG